MKEQLGREYSDQNYHFTTGALDQNSDRGCAPTCLFVPLVGVSSDIAGRIFEFTFDRLSATSGVSNIKQLFVQLWQSTVTTAFQNATSVLGPLSAFLPTPVVTVQEVSGASPNEEDAAADLFFGGVLPDNGQPLTLPGQARLGFLFSSDTLFSLLKTVFSNPKMSLKGDGDVGSEESSFRLNWGNSVTAETRAGVGFGDGVQGKGAVSPSPAPSME